MYRILIAFKPQTDPNAPPDQDFDGDCFTLGSFTCYAAAEAYANYYRPYSRKMFSIPCIVTVQAHFEEK